MSNSDRGVKYIEIGTANQDVQANTMSDDMEKLVHGVTTHNMLSDADYTLTETNAEFQYLNKYIKITDTGPILTAARNIIIPAVDWVYVVDNDTLQDLTVKTSGGTGALVPAQTQAIVVCDGTDSARLFLGPANNLTATTDPTAGDDAADGYAEGSVWINTTKNWTWVCVDSTAGSALWDLATNAVQVITETSSSRTLALSDLGSGIRFTNGGGCDLTVPPNSSVNFPVGSVIPLRGAGSGTYTVVAGSGVTVNPPNGGTLVLAGNGAGAALWKVSGDTWDLFGQTVAA